MNVPTKYKFLELGPEANVHTGWRKAYNSHWWTLGQSSKTAPRQDADLNNDFDLPDERFDIVFASHVMEHVKNPHHFVRQCARVLKPGGTLRLVVPSPVKLMELYFRNVISLGNLVDALRSRQHLQAFDKVEIKNLFRKKWLVGLRFPTAGESRIPLLQKPYFSTRPNRSLYIEASKP